MLVLYDARARPFATIVVRRPSMMMGKLYGAAARLVFHMPAVEVMLENTLAFDPVMVGFIYFAQAAVGMIFGHDDATVPLTQFGGAPLTSLYSFLKVVMSVCVSLLSILQV